MEPPSPHLNSDEISKSKARAAARAALEDMFLTPTQKSRTTSFALYTWAGLAVLSAAVALTIGLVPNGSQQDTQIVASVSGTFSDDLPDITKTEFPKLPTASVVAESDQKKLLEERPDLDATTTAAIAPEEIAPAPIEAVPIAEPQSVANEGLGVDIGGSNSIPTLAIRFKALQVRSPELFAGLNPLVRFSESQGRLDARLIAGPFTSSQQLADFCRSVRLQLTLDCKQTDYQGDPIPLGN